MFGVFGVPGVLGGIGAIGLYELGTVWIPLWHGWSLFIQVRSDDMTFSFGVKPNQLERGLTFKSQEGSQRK